MSDRSEGRWRERLRGARTAFRGWRHSRPFWGGLLVLLSGLQIYYSTQLSLGNLQIRIGVEGLQSVVIPVIMITAGVLIWFMPAHRVFYGVIALVVAVYSLIGVNLGGFFIGMLLGILGGSLSVAWSPREPAASADESVDELEDEAADDTRPDAAAIPPAEVNVPFKDLFDERQGRG